jgi:hypothetical protein
MSVMFIDRAKRQGKLNTEEVRRLNDAIEKDDGTDRVSHDEGVVTEKVLKEYKIMKIVNNRDSDTKNEDYIGNVNYADNRSRWSKWNEFNNLQIMTNSQGQVLHQVGGGHNQGTIVEPLTGLRLVDHFPLGVHPEVYQEEDLVLLEAQDLMEDPEVLEGLLVEVEHHSVRKLLMGVVLRLVNLVLRRW